MDHARVWTRLVALLAVATWACDGPASDPGSGSPITTSTEQQSFFDDFFAGPASSGTVTVEVPSCPPDDPECERTPIDPPTPEPVEPPTCSQPLPAPSGASTPCGAFCQAVGACMGASGADVSGCASDCAASLGGIELNAASEILNCYATAGCEALLAWAGGDDGTSTTEPAPPPQADPVPPEGEPTEPPPPPEEGGSGAPAEFVVESGSTAVIEECLESLLVGWAQAGPTAGAATFCEQLATNACNGAGATPTTDPDPGNGFAPPPDPDEPPPPEPVPPEEDHNEVDAEAAMMCAAISHMITGPAMSRFQSCMAIEDCDAQDACAEEVLTCLPFLQSVMGMGGGSASSGTGTVGVGGTEPSETQPPSTEPEPEPDPGPGDPPE